MRFYIVLATLSLFIWAAAAGVSGVSYPSVKAVEETPTDDAAAPVAEAAGPAIPAPGEHLGWTPTFFLMSTLCYR